jgi:hypothetical protein
MDLDFRSVFFFSSTFDEGACKDFITMYINSPTRTTLR